MKPLYVRIDGSWVGVETFGEASRKVRDYIESNDLGSSEWKGGAVRDSAGKAAGRISYNGRAWRLDGTEIVEGN